MSRPIYTPKHIYPNWGPPAWTPPGRANNWSGPIALPDIEKALQVKLGPPNGPAQPKILLTGGAIGFVYAPAY